MSHPTVFTTPGVRAFAEAVDAERQRQLVKFGDQHHPDIDPRDIAVVTRHFFQHKAQIHREVNEERATPSRTVGRCSRCPEGDHTHTAWDLILLEKVYEALAESDPGALRTELVQVAAVCAAWSADIDSRTAAEPECPQAPLSLGAAPPKRCTVRGPHTEHATEAAEEQPACSAGLLPFGPGAPEPCIVHGPHEEHRNAGGDTWTDGAMADRCPVKHGALGRICGLEAGHDGLHTGEGPNGGAVWEGSAR
ncbi:hypothetical protein [Streptomyces phytophilus]|uniref:hypothetical protein n=1 Tax=Streptomyces phytophilus TaxID=722715 RepID=UPI0015EFEB80|nr:hypothetical protein [Streptomyces phytophilus]